MILLLVFRNRLNASIRPVHRIKHVIDFSTSLVAGTKSTVDLINTKDQPDPLVTTNEVQTGSRVNAIYLKAEIYATSTAGLANAYMSVNKNPGSSISPADPNIIGLDKDKKYVIHQEMVMMEKNTTGNPRTLFNGVIVLPRGYRRFGPSDKLQVSFLTPLVTADYCLQCHYKEFR